MELYFIRHAAAEPVGQENDYLDERRRLTAEGRQRMQETAAGLRSLGVKFDAILTSPLMRAIETAEIIAQALEMDRNLIQRTAALAPQSTVGSLVIEIRKHAELAGVAIIGHQPDIGQAISRVVCGYPDASIQFKKGSVCAVRVSETAPTIRGVLLWLMTPKQLRVMSKV
jgi:phosphohistidine phosphatase